MYFLYPLFVIRKVAQFVVCTGNVGVKLPNNEEPLTEEREIPEEANTRHLEVGKESSKVFLAN